MRTVFDKHKLAWKHFWPEGNGRAKEGHCLHHVDSTLRHTNPERYNEWRIEDLVMITDSEHALLHHTGFVYSEESRERMRKVQKERAKNMSEDERLALSERMKTLWQDEEYRSKTIEPQKGRIPWNKGKTNCYSEEYRKHMSETLKGRPSKFKGKKYTEEQRLAKSEQMKRWAIERKKALMARKSEEVECGWRLESTPKGKE